MLWNMVGVHIAAQCVCMCITLVTITQIEGIVLALLVQTSLCVLRKQALISG